MDKNEELRGKLLAVIEQMLISRPEISPPLALENYLLKKYGWSYEDGPIESRDDLTQFVELLQEWVDNKYSSENFSETNHKKSESHFSNFQEILHNHLEVESKYVNVVSMIIGSWEKMFELKENVSKITKLKCEQLDSEIKILNQKMLFLKHQFFLKLYGENNALNAHLKLQEKLKHQLEVLKKNYSDAVQLSKQYSEIKENKNFMELYRVFKELKKIEKRTEIIRNM